MSNNDEASETSSYDALDTGTYPSSDNLSFMQENHSFDGASPCEDSDQSSSSRSADGEGSSHRRLPNLTAPAQNVLTDPTIAFRAHSSHRHSTWARTFCSRPELYICPQSVEEVQKIVLLARRCRRRVQTVGAGHSPSILTCTSAWMVDLKDLSHVLAVERDKEGGGGRVLVEAGISLGELNRCMAQHHLTIPNLGSIDVQSIAGAIATATHGSSKRHGVLSENVRGLRIVLADGRAVWCDARRQVDLFRAALVSLGAIGIIAEVEFWMSASADIEWEQTLVSLDYVLSNWEKELWTQAEFVRCWWLPYLKRTIIWKANKTEKPRRQPKNSWYGSLIGFHTYHILLWIAHHFPSVLPTVEWFVFGMQYGFKPGSVASAVEEMKTGLLMDCLYSQFVNEWAIPLRKGPEAISRLSKWLNGEEAASRIPFSSKGLYVHSPIEVRVTDGSTSKSPVPRAFMDPTFLDEPTLYLNATLYRPYGLDPPCRERYYEAFEWLMKEMGGRPHWAKNFATVTKAELLQMYGEDMEKYLEIRKEVDPDGLFVGAWQRKYLLGQEPVAVLEEKEVERRKATGVGGLCWMGEQAGGREKQSSTMVKRRVDDGSVESFDLLDPEDELIVKG